MASRWSWVRSASRTLASSVEYDLDGPSPPQMRRSAPTSATVGVNQTNPISGVSLSETGNTTTSGETFTVTLADTHGDLSVSETTGVSGSGTTSLSITGSLAQVNTDLTSLSDTDGTSGSDAITVSATDSFGNSATQKTIPA